MKVRNPLKEPLKNLPVISGWKIKIIDRRVQGQSLNLFQSIAHYFLKWLSSDYKVHYQAYKNKFFDSTGVQHAPSKHKRATDTFDSIHKKLKTSFIDSWLCKPLDMKEETWNIGDRQGVISWKNPMILCFGMYDKQDGIDYSAESRLKRHGRVPQANYLSNYHPCRVKIDFSKHFPGKQEQKEIIFKSLEHFYQAVKHIDNPPIFNKVLKADSPNDARMIARKHQAKNLDDKELIRIMKIGLYSKFTNPNGTANKFGKELIKTENQLLIEGNRRDGGSDKRWGAEFIFTNSPEVSLTGANWLGKLLMELRKELNPS